MNKSQRWMIIFSLIIAVLMIATTLGVLLSGDESITLLPEDSPEGVVQRYLIAIKDQDYQKAWDYLHIEEAAKPMTFNDWLMSVPYKSSNTPLWKATLGKTIFSGSSATVEAFIDVFRSSGPFDDPVQRQQILFKLTNINNRWLIISPTYIYWIY